MPPSRERKPRPVTRADIQPEALAAISPELSLTGLGKLAGIQHRTSLADGQRATPNRSKY